MIRVMIVEDQKLVRSLLESYIQNEDGYQLAVSIPGAAEAPILCDTEDIDLVLMDVQTEHRENGLAAAKKIRKAHPEIKIVVATSLIDTQVLARAKAVGADSLWYKDHGTDAIMDVIRRTMAGERVIPGFSPSVEMKRCMSEDFTPAQIEILRAFIKGYTYREIAEKFNLSVSGVRYNIAEMVRIGGFKNKEELTTVAIENKLVVTTLDDGETE